jgi:glycosyltransferase involved in cell wall biosynthesis
VGMDLKSKSVVIAVLCFNEEKTIPLLLEQIMNIQSSWQFKTEIVVFDNSSSDNTVKSANKFFLSNPEIKGIVHKNRENLGYSGNVFQSILYFQESQSDYLIIIDGDGQFPASYTPEFISKLLNGDNLVLTKRTSVDQKVHRQLASLMFRFLSTLIIGSKMKDINGGLRAIDRKLLNSLTGFHKGITANPLLYYVAKQNDLRISWVYLNPQKRLAGESFLNFSKPFSLTLTSIIELIQIKKKKYHWKINE